MAPCRLDQQRNLAGNTCRCTITVPAAQQSINPHRFVGAQSRHEAERKGRQLMTLSWTERMKVTLCIVTIVNTWSESSAKGLQRSLTMQKCFLTISGVIGMKPKMRKKVHLLLLPLFAVLFALCTLDDTVQEKTSVPACTWNWGCEQRAECAAPGCSTGLRRSNTHWKRDTFACDPFKNGKLLIPETLSQVNHCKGVNNSAEYKSVRQFVSTYIFEKAARAFWNIIKTVLSGKLNMFLILSVTHNAGTETIYCTCEPVFSEQWYFSKWFFLNKPFECFKYSYIISEWGETRLARDHSLFMIDTFLSNRQRTLNIKQSLKWCSLTVMQKNQSSCGKWFNQQYWDRTHMKTVKTTRTSVMTFNWLSRQSWVCVFCVLGVCVCL